MSPAAASTTASDDAGRALLADYDRSLPQVYGYLMARVRSAAVAEDLASETYLAAVDAIGRGTLRAPTTAWLIGVARHKLVDHWRRQARDDRRLAAVADLVVEHEDPWDARLQVAHAHEVLDGLGPHHRSALTLRYLDGLSVPEVAFTLDRTVHATEALLVRARRAFRAAYEAAEDPTSTDRRPGSPNDHQLRHFDQSTDGETVMPETHDPFDDLRLPAAPLAPRPGFATELRARLGAALSPTEPEPRSTNEEIPMSTTESSATAEAQGAPPQVLTPYLAIAGAAEAIDWYRDVLGAIETTRFVGDDGRVGHAELTIGTAKIMLADEFPEMDVVAPPTVGGTTVALHLEVVDVDHSYGRAVEAGAVSLREPADQGHGNRNATILDPFGHRWMLSQPIDADRTATATEAKGAGGNGQDWKVSGRQPVEPGYLTIHSPDLALARTFYGGLFDWEIADGNVEGGGHVANTHFPMGIAPMNEEIGQGGTIYFRVHDIDTYTAKVIELGGQVLELNDYPSGGNASCVDDQGRRFDLFRPNPGY